MPDDVDQLIERIFGTTDRQIEQTRQILTNHLDASDRIHQRQASETVVRLAETLAQNPTS